MRSNNATHADTKAADLWRIVSQIATISLKSNYGTQKVLQPLIYIYIYSICISISLGHSMQPKILTVWSYNTCSIMLRKYMTLVLPCKYICRTIYISRVLKAVIKHRKTKTLNIIYCIFDRNNKFVLCVCISKQYIMLND